MRPPTVPADSVGGSPLKKNQPHQKTQPHQKKAKSPNSQLQVQHKAEKNSTKNVKITFFLLLFHIFATNYIEGVENSPSDNEGTTPHEDRDT